MNEKQIKALTWVKDKRIALGDGLYLNIRKSSKTYIIRKTANGRASVITLGKSPGLSLKLARIKALQLSTVIDISNITICELIEKYWVEIVEPTSKVPKQVRGYLDLDFLGFARHLIALKSNSMRGVYEQQQTVHRRI